MGSRSVHQPRIGTRIVGSGRHLEGSALVRKASAGPLDKVDGSARLIGVVVPNKPTRQELEWDTFRGAGLKRIEELTGFTFFRQG